MQDETPINGLHRGKQSGKPFLRTQRIAAPRMVEKTSVRFDEATRDKLTAQLSPSKRPPVGRPKWLDAETLRQLDATTETGSERTEAALRISESIAGTFNRRLAQGWNKSPAPREETRRALVKVRRLLARRIANPDEPLAPLLDEIPSGGELENRLIRAGWEEEQLYADPDFLLPVVDSAIRNLRIESRENGRRPEWAEREALHCLATVWWWVTGRPVSLWREADGTQRCPFAAFAEEVISAANRAEGRDVEPIRGRIAASLLADLF